MTTRRKFIKYSGLTGFALYADSKLGWVRKAFAAPAAAGLSDPASQPKFVNAVPDALNPLFKILTPQSNDKYLKVFAGATVHQTGLVDGSGNKLTTAVWGYGSDSWNYGTPTWPGPTIEAKSRRKIKVRWENRLGNGHLLPVDESLHWCYSLPGYEQYSIANNGVPIVSHLHGGHTDFQFDGNPEFFFSPGFAVRGPQFVDKTYLYDNSQPAGNLWYHDHALGITRLNVYAGLAGFYFLRDRYDTGDWKNRLGVPAWPYEKAYAIQDRMFLADGALFYPAYPGDPFYDDFITGEGAVLPDPPFTGGGPTALAEFFGDHMVVNGKIWPYEAVEPRNYRLHLLNGTDSRFMAIRFRVVGDADASVPGNGPTTIPGDAPYVPFTVIGSDQGLASAPTPITGDGFLLSEPGSRYDIVIDFGDPALDGKRIIMENIGGDEPFGGDIPGPVVFNETDRIMAFDVTLGYGALSNEPDPTLGAINFGPNVPDPATRTRKVALFEGKDEFGRLQPLLGTAEPATDYANNPINWPNTAEYTSVNLIGQMEGSIAWHSPTTENPALGDTEEWEIWNVTGDAHPVHLHLVHFEILGRQEIVWDSHTIAAGDTLPGGGTATEDDETRVIPNDFYPGPADDGTYLVVQPTVQHNSVAGDPATYGMGFKIMTPDTGAVVPKPAGYVEDTPKDMVTALPGQVTRIKAKFDKPGRYVWHCHILSHEDHEMMRVLHVGPGA
jgi:FtsP/CotA-like multicopper oxidase with cupredoxin domain